MSKEGIPNLPIFYQMKKIDKEGSLTPEAQLYESEVSQTLNHAIELLNAIAASTVDTGAGSNGERIVNNGLLAPQKTTTQIAELEASSAVGTIWFDTDIAKLKVKTAPGTIQTITST